MRRLPLFATFIAAAVAGLVALAAWYLESYQVHGGSVSGMMGQMIGSENGTLTPMPASVWALMVALLAVGFVGIVGVLHYAIYPEFRTHTSVERGTETTGREAVQKGTDREQEPSWSVLVRTSKPEERKVLDVLANHNGRYLQKFIVKESGLTKLKTHRILSRFAERGIVTAMKSGNTNEIALAPWLRPERAPSVSPPP